MAQDPRRLFDAKDIEAAGIFANLITGGAEDFYPLKVDANGYLLISMTVGSVSLSSTASTITNAVGNPVNVSLTSTVVTIESTGLNVTPTTTASTITNAVGNPVNVALTSTEVTVKSAVAGFNVNVATATLGTVTVTGTVTPSTTASTIANAVDNPVNVALTSTVVTVRSVVAGGFNVNIATATLGTVTTSLASTLVTIQNTAGVVNVSVRSATLGTVTTSFASTLVTTHLSPTTTRVSVTMITGVNGVSAGVGASDTGTQRVVLANDMGRTLTGATGTISATWTSIFTPTNKCKIYAFSFTTTSASEVTVIIADGLFANAKEKWRATLMAPAGSSAGANLAIAPPAYLFSSRSTSAITISLSTAVLVHYSLSFFDEA